MQTTATGLTVHNTLQDKKCDEIQGFYYARPMPEAQFIEYVRKSDNHKKL